MQSEILLALILKKVDERVAEMRSLTSTRGPRGQRGLAGTAGTNFVFAEHADAIKKIIQETSIQFGDLTEDQVATLRGPKGRDGKDGDDGKSFVFEDHEETIKQWAKEFAVKFEDFTADQIGALRGPKGRDGKDGEDFKFDAHKEDIEVLLSGLVYDSWDKLKCTFNDFTADEIAQLRGPKGRDGDKGRDFNLEEHKGYFESLVPKFSDFSVAEIEKLRLHFSDLTPEERASLKLHFEELTEGEKAEIKGPRGPRGQRGSPGDKGDTGDKGEKGQSIRGVPGAKGARGFSGTNGRDGTNGEDGKDAPYVTDIRVDQFRTDEAEFIFDFSDGSSITTNAVKLPRSNIYIGGGGSSSGGNGGGTGTDGKSAYEIAVENGFVGTEEEWLESLQGESAYDVAVDNGFVGTEEEWLESLVGPPGPGGGIDPITGSVPVGADALIDVVPAAQFSSIEYSVTLRRASVRCYKKFVVIKGEVSDLVSDWDPVSDVDPIGSFETTAETIWTSSVPLDVGIVATLVGDDMHLVFHNNESFPVTVTGTKMIIPEF